MKQKNVWIALALCLLLTVTIPVQTKAWSLKHGLFHQMADSNDVIVLTVDSATLALDSLEEWIDTTYLPSSHGYNLGWAQQYLFAYNVADIDSSPAASGLQQAMDNDSAHLGFDLQSSIDGIAWYSVEVDSTIRTAFTPDGDSTTRHMGLHSIDTLITQGTICGPLWRIATYIYRSPDTTDNTHTGINDTIWLGNCRLRGFAFDE